VNCGQVDDECSKIYREQMDLRLCPACYKMLDDILEEVSEARRKAYQEAMNAGNEQGDPDDAILCDNCESWFPPDVMTAVEDGDASVLTVWRNVGMKQRKTLVMNCMGKQVMIRPSVRYLEKKVLELLRLPKVQAS
jgi:hypothetical protein